MIISTYYYLWRCLMLASITFSLSWGAAVLDLSWATEEFLPQWVQKWSWKTQIKAHTDIQTWQQHILWPQKAPRPRTQLTDDFGLLLMTHNSTFQISTPFFPHSRQNSMRFNNQDSIHPILSVYYSHQPKQELVVILITKSHPVQRPWKTPVQCHDCTLTIYGLKFDLLAKIRLAVQR